MRRAVRQVVLGRHNVAQASSIYVATLGNSITEYGANGYVGNEAVVALNPTQRLGYQGWLESLSGGRIASPPTYNQGLAGDTSAPYLALPGISSRVATVNATDADWVILTSPCTNDRTQGQSAGWSITKVDGMLASLINAGKRVVLITELPRNDISGATMTDQQTVADWELAQHGRSRKVIAIDSRPLLRSAVGATDMLPAYTVDGLHPNQTGYRILAQAIWTALQGYFVNYPAIIAASSLYNRFANREGNLLAAGALSGTGGSLSGGPTGTLATGGSITAIPTGTTLDCAANQTAVGFDGQSHSDWQKFTFAGTPSTATVSFQCTFLPTVAGNLLAGDVLYGWYEIRVETATNACSIGARARVQYSGGVPAQQLASENNTVSIVGNLPDGPYTAIIRLPEITVQSGTVTACQLELTPQLIQSAAGNLIFYVRELRLAKKAITSPSSGVFDFTSGSLPAGAILTRASAATYIDANGVMQSAAVNAARFDHVYALGAYVATGIVNEPAATNLLLRSAQFDNASWAKTGASTVTADQAAAPDGTASMDAYTETSSSSAMSQAATVTSGAAYTFSVYAKRSNTDWVMFAVGDSPNITNSVRAWFNLATGATGTLGTLGTGWTATASTITDIGGGIYRCTVTVVTSGTSAYCRFQTAAANSTTNRANIGSGAGIGGAILLWGAQIEAGTVATSYIGTTTATAGRSADVLTLDWASKGLADGTYTMRHLLGDNTLQDISVTVASGTAVVSTTLNYPAVKKVWKL